jgi:D-methionine transport system ATP-binding protein
MIELKNISKTFHQNKQTFKALHDVSLTVQKGHIAGIIGFSGAGKSTLIRCMNLLEQPDQGQVIINGVELTKLHARKLANERKKIGMIFQHFNLLSSRTVFENVALPLELDRKDKIEIDQKVNSLLKIVGLDEKADDYPKSLSGGQKQRVAIARALASDPHVLLCDEATSSLDPVTTQSILQLLRDINQQLNITIVLITHEMEVVKAICNYVAVIDKGELIAKGSIENILSHKEHPIINQFITTATMAIPQQFQHTFQREHQAGLYPLIEIQLNGNILFDTLLTKVQSTQSLPYSILKADVEYLGNANFGKILLYLKGSTTENETTIQLLNQRKIQNTIKGYA